MRKQSREECVFASVRDVWKEASDMDFLSRKKELSSTESAHIIIFFLFRNTQRNPSQNRKKKHQREKKTSFYICCARLLLQRRRETREMPGNPPPPLTRLLLPCWQDVMLHLGTDSLRECQREILNRAGFPTWVWDVFVCLLPRFWFYASSCARNVLFLRAFSLSLSLKTETKDAL